MEHKIAILKNFLYKYQIYSHCLQVFIMTTSVLLFLPEDFIVILNHARNGITYSLKTFQTINKLLKNDCWKINNIILNKSDFNRTHIASSVITTSTAYTSSLCYCWWSTSLPISFWYFRTVSASVKSTIVVKTRR